MARCRLLHIFFILVNKSHKNNMKIIFLDKVTNYDLVSILSIYSLFTIPAPDESSSVRFAKYYLAPRWKLCYLHV